jgi:hypothetical protein
MKTPLTSLVNTSLRRLLVDGEAPVSGRLSESPSPDREGRCEEAVAHRRGEQGRGHHCFESNQTDERNPRRTRRGERPDGEQSGERHDDLGGQDLYTETSHDRHGHHQFGTPAPPAQGGPLDHGKRLSEGPHGLRGALVLLADGEDHEQADPPRDGEIREALERSARGRAHRPIVSDPRKPRIGLRDEPGAA